MRRFLYLLPVFLLGLTACDTVLDTNPEASVDADVALATPGDVAAALTGAYSVLQGGDVYAQATAIIPDLYADNLDHTGTFSSFAEVDAQNIFPSNVEMNGIWTSHYDGINRVNSILAGLENVEGAPDSYRGEALFLRALYHFNLARFFGGVPIVVEPTTEIADITEPARDDLAAVYAQVEADLLEAEGLLNPANAPGRATTMAATALRARLHLEQGQYQDAIDAATAVIESGEYALTDSYDEIFARQNTSESILEVQFSVNDPNSHAFWLFPSALGGRREYAPTSDLYAAYPEGDLRRDVTIGVSGGSLYGTKYFRIANGDDHVPVLRLAEMYLIRAEANAELGAPAATVLADVNVVRERAGVDPITSTDEALIDVVLAERRLEFALEGHRFFDLRRAGQAVEVLGLDSADRLLFPIPQAERDVNSNLGQNPGY